MTWLPLLWRCSRAQHPGSLFDHGRRGARADPSQWGRPRSRL